MHVELRTAVVLAAVSLAAVAGCGTDAGSEPAAGSSEAKASSLSESEARELCEQVQHELEEARATYDFINTNCGVRAKTEAEQSGATGDDLTSACRKEYDACVADPPFTGEGTVTDDVGDDPCADFVTHMKSCSATVNAVKQCWSDSAAWLRANNTQDYCDPSTAPEPGMPGSCQALAGKCL